jgi:outer membrane protein
MRVAGIAALLAVLVGVVPSARAADDPALPAELSLEAALTIGRTHQPQLRQARAQVAAADARVDEARASLLPQVNATGSYSRSTGNLVAAPGSIGSGGGTVGNTTSFDTFSFWRSGVTLTQLIWDFGQAWNRRAAARASADAQGKTEQATGLNTDLAIRNAYFVARAARDAVSVARTSLDNQTRHVDQIRAFTEVGTRPQIDLLQAEADQANAEVSLINAQNDYATARAILNQTMGVEAPATYEVAGPPSAPLAGEDGALDALVDEAVRARPEIAALLDQLRAQDLLIRATKDRYLPALSATTGLTYNGPDLGRLTWNWSGGLVLSWSIFEGGLVQATVREGNALAAALRAQSDTLRQQVRVEVDQARLAIAAAKAALSAAGRSLSAANGRLDLAEVRYRTGVGSGIELSDAQLAATNAAFQQLQAALKLDTARAQLQKALGRP